MSHFGYNGGDTLSEQLSNSLRHGRDSQARQAALDPFANVQQVDALVADLEQAIGRYRQGTLQKRQKVIDGRTLVTGQGVADNINRTMQQQNAAFENFRGLFANPALGRQHMETKVASTFGKSASSATQETDPVLKALQGLGEAFSQHAQPTFPMSDREKMKAQQAEEEAKKVGGATALIQQSEQQHQEPHNVRAAREQEKIDAENQKALKEKQEEDLKDQQQKLDEALKQEELEKKELEDRQKAAEDKQEEQKIKDQEDQDKAQKEKIKLEQTNLQTNEDSYKELFAKILSQTNGEELSEQDKEAMIAMLSHESPLGAAIKTAGESYMFLKNSDFNFEKIADEIEKIRNLLGNEIKDMKATNEDLFNSALAERTEKMNGTGNLRKISINASQNLLRVLENIASPPNELDLSHDSYKKYVQNLQAMAVYYETTKDLTEQNAVHPQNLLEVMGNIGHLGNLVPINKLDSINRGRKKKNVVL